MGQLTLTNIDDALMESLELRAKATGRSIAEVAKEALERGLLLDVRGRVAVADQIRGMTPKPLNEDSTDIIRRMRDAS